ncbi:MAG: type I restriction endonuclease subunit R, partial [Chloroflexi bacterium]|nr:type I restriction endonuclease subunit R [Chloroflexota bacterium]
LCLVDLHEHAIDAKVAIMVEHFAQQIAGRIGGRAKAMIVTRSRLHAVRYKLAVDAYLKEKGYPFKSLVAFTGTVKDDGALFTEAGMNGFPEKQTAEAFKRDEYRLLIAANKFQTGFDQPLLHTMYVDKRLRGVNAVQTLSRLNRVCLDKNETMVLDFANEAFDIQQSFQPYYETTMLQEATDPNLLYDLQNRLEAFHIFEQADVNRFAAVYFGTRASQAKLHSALAPAMDRYKAAKEEDRAAFRGQLAEYVRLYAFLSQIVTFVDTDLEKLYVYGRLLLRKLPAPRDRLPVEIQQNIDIASYTIRKTSSGKIKLERGSAELDPLGLKKVHEIPPENLESLSQIIHELNQRFGTDFTEEDKVFIQQLEARLHEDTALEASVRVNPPDNVRLTFDHVVNDRLQEMIDADFRFYKQVTDDPEFAKFFYRWLFERYYSRKGKKPADFQSAN